MSGTVTGFDEPDLRRGPPLTSTGGQLEVVDFGDDADAGGDSLRQAEQLTPFLRMLQGLSPQINPGKAEYIPGAQLGMILNTATSEFWPGAAGIDAMLAYRTYHYGMWIPRDLGSGFRGTLPPEHELVKRTLARMNAKYGGSGKFKFPRYRDGRWTDDPPRAPDTDEAVELVETGQYYLIYAPAGELSVQTARRAIIGFTSTSLPVYQGVNTRWLDWTFPQANGGMARAPFWAYRWRITTRQDKNAKGEFYNWNFQLAPVEGVPPQELTYRRALVQRTDSLYVLAKEFYEQVHAGLVQPDYESAEASSAGVREDDDPVPF